MRSSVTFVYSPLLAQGNVGSELDSASCPVDSLGVCVVPDDGRGETTARPMQRSFHSLYRLQHYSHYLLLLDSPLLYDLPLCGDIQDSCGATSEGT